MGSENESNGLFECFHCLHRSLLWNCDYDFEDLGYEGEGIVQMLTCMNCGAEVEYRVRFDSDEEEEGDAESGREETDNMESGASVTSAEDVSGRDSDPERGDPEGPVRLTLCK